MAIYGWYLLAEGLGAAVFALIIIIGLVFYALIPAVFGHRDKYGNMRTFIGWMFPSFINNDPRENENPENPPKTVTTLFGYDIQEWYVIWLYVMMMFIVVLTVTIFWVNFFIETSTSCNPFDDFDCFPNKRPQDIFYEKPLDCPNNNSVICKKFGCNIGNAVGLATGAFAFSWISATIFLWIVTKFLKEVLKEDTNVDNSCCRGCTRILCDCLNVRECFRRNQRDNRQQDTQCKTCCKFCYIIFIITFQVVVFLTATGLAAGGLTLYLLDKVSFTCCYEVGIFSTVIIMASTLLWCCGFKKRKQDIEMRQDNAQNHTENNVQNNIQNHNENNAQNNNEEDNAQNHNEEDNAQNHNEEDNAQNHNEEDNAQNHNEEDNAQNHNEEDNTQNHNEDINQPPEDRLAYTNPLASLPSPLNSPDVTTSTTIEIELENIPNN